MTTSVLLNGRVHGQTIEFDEPLPCGDGQRVRVMLLPNPAVISTEPLPPGEGLRRAFGAWAEGGDELDQLPQREGLRRAFGILSQEEGQDLDRFVESSRRDSYAERASEQT